MEEKYSEDTADPGDGHTGGVPEEQLCLRVCIHRQVLYVVLLDYAHTVVKSS